MNHPLHWPTGWKRCKHPRGSQFAKTATIAVATDEVLHELEMLGATSAVISTNVAVRLDGLPRSDQKAPEDSGVAVYYDMRIGREVSTPFVLACDKWNKVAHNLRAVAHHIRALRGMDRWGVGSVEKAFAGYKALPEAKPRPSCWKVLGMGGPPAAADRVIAALEIRAAYKARCVGAHPDSPNGSHEAFVVLGAAKTEALEYVGGVAELLGGER